MKHYLCLLLATSLGAMSFGAAAAVHDWTATRIGPFDAPLLDVDGMNNAGQLAVTSVSPSPRPNVIPHELRAFLYTPGSSGGLVDLGSLGGPQSVTMALNASGQVVGWSTPRGRSLSSANLRLPIRPHGAPGPARRGRGRRVVRWTSTIAARSSRHPSARTKSFAAPSSNRPAPHRPERPRGRGWCVWHQQSRPGLRQLVQAHRHP